MFDTELPGKAEAYVVRAFEGPRRLIGGLLASVLARGEDNDGNYSLSVIQGGMGAGLPMVRHDGSRVVLHVLTGRLEVTAGDETRLLSQGDLAVVPAGEAYGLVCRSHRTVFQHFSTGADAGRFLWEAGAPYANFMPPEAPEHDMPDLASGTPAGSTLVGAYPAGRTAAPVTETASPGADRVFFLLAGEGERLATGDQMFNLAITNAETGGDFIAVGCEGPRGDMIPPHYHEKHHEMFFCLEGQVNMIVNDDRVTLYPGDFAAVPPGTIHAYQMAGAYNRHFGYLVSGLFEPFFRTLGEPYPHHVAPNEPRPFRFDRVIEKVMRGELDLKPLQRPE